MSKKSIIEEVAERFGVSPEEVYAEINAAIGQAFHSDDLATRRAWKELCPDGVQPTPEDAIMLLVGKVRSAQKRKQ